MSGIVKGTDTIFIHVQKTAGTSIARLPWIRTRGHNPIWTFPKEARRRANFSFAFVRHPQDRFMSATTAGMLIFGEPPFGPRPNPPSFKEMKETATKLIANISKTEKGKPFNPKRNWQRTPTHPHTLPHFVGWPYRVHYFPMWFFLTDPDYRMGVEFIGRYERLAEDWGKICYRMGASYEPLPHRRNASLYRAPLQDYYTKETAKMIADLYQKDFELFDYEPY